MEFQKLLPLALAAIGTAAHADVTVVTNTSGKASFLNVGGTSTVAFKGTRSRTDSVMGGRNDSLVIDLDGRRFVQIDDKKKSATVTPLDAIREQLDKVGMSGMQATLKKTAETKKVAGYDCTVHDVSISLPFSVTGNPGDGMDMTMLLSGQVCLSSNVPGLADYQKFYRASADSGFIFGDPRATKSPTVTAQAKAYAELTRKMAEAGMALDCHITITATGSNPMAGMMAKLAASDITTTVTQITAGDVPAERFDVPAGYKVKTQK